MKSQQRFIFALVASAAVLIGWNYFFPPVPPPQNANQNANANQQVAQASPQVTAGGSPQASLDAGEHWQRMRCRRRLRDRNNLRFEHPLVNPGAPKTHSPSDARELHLP